MRIVSWNVNGLRACITKGFLDFFHEMDADIFCIQESKMQEGQAEIITCNHKQYWNCAEKKGYSGTVIFTKEEPLSVTKGIHGKYNEEGRAITLEYDKFYLTTVYSPNSQSELARLEFRMEFEDDLRNYLTELSKKKPVILCGDLNVAHEEIDLKNPKANIGNAGFSYEEREKFSQLLKAGFIDSYRYLNPEETDCYTWWSYRFGARPKNIGWRLDYFIISDSLKHNIKDFIIHSKILGSDHCPVELQLSL